ncbi:MAG: aminoglycoside phosphotransferase family protein [Patescibacteria group bacterium]
MLDYDSLIKKIGLEFPEIKREIFEGALSGTHYKVFLSENFTVRFRDDNPELLLREADFLKRLDHSLIPKVLWEGKIDNTVAMVENRLPGKTIDTVWKTLPEDNKADIVGQVVQFLHYLQTKNTDSVYSVSTGKKYNVFWDFLTDNISSKVTHIKKRNQADVILKELLLIIDESKFKNLFLDDKEKIALVHGDLIIHNLLTDGKNLTGVLDWELSLFGDSDYDLSRLFYYQECAKAYQEQGIDETFEADYMDKLIATILKSNLIENKKKFLEKHQFMRAIFYFNALFWATNSNDSEKDIADLIILWNKKRD